MSRYGTSQDDSPDMLFRKLQIPLYYDFKGKPKGLSLFTWLFKIVSFAKLMKKRIREGIRKRCNPAPIQMQTKAGMLSLIPNPLSSYQYLSSR